MNEYARLSLNGRLSLIKYIQITFAVNLLSKALKKKTRPFRRIVKMLQVK